VIRVEKLSVKGMTRSARGTVNSPGRNIAGKAEPNQAILKSGWGMVVTRWSRKHPAGSRRSILPTRGRPVMPASTSRRGVVRAKRSSC